MADWLWLGGVVDWLTGGGDDGVADLLTEVWQVIKNTWQTFLCSLEIIIIKNDSLKHFLASINVIYSSISLSARHVVYLLPSNFTCLPLGAPPSPWLYGLGWVSSLYFLYSLVRLASVTFTASSYLLWIFCSTMIVLSSKWSPIRGAAKILLGCCCYGMPFWLRSTDRLSGLAPPLPCGELWGLTGEPNIAETCKQRR